MNQGTFSDCFAQWLIEAGKVSEFMDILIKEGCPLTILVSAVNKHRYTVVKESEMPTHGDEWCQCENCRTLRAAEKAVLEHGGKEYVPEETSSDHERRLYEREMQRRMGNELDGF